MESNHVHNFGDCELCRKPLSLTDWMTHKKHHKTTALLCALCFGLSMGSAEIGFHKIADNNHPVNGFLSGAQYLVDGTSTSTLNVSAFMLITDFAAIQPEISHPAPNPVSLPKLNSELV